MPELPDVEKARQLLEKACLNVAIKDIVVTEQGGGARNGLEDDIVFEDVAPKDFRSKLIGRKIVAVKRKGKHLWLEMDKGPQPMLHFGMSGAILVQGYGAATYERLSVDDKVWPPKFSKVEFILEDGTRWVFVDFRRLGRVRLEANAATSPTISALGFDSYNELPDVAEFTKMLRGRRGSIKPVLLDQSFSAGIGNWIADEVLFQARLHPARAIADCTDEQIAALHAAIKYVVQHAVTVNSDSSQFPKTWLFHYRWEKGASSARKRERETKRESLPAEDVKVEDGIVSAIGKTIEYLTVGGRTTAVIPEIQGTPSGKPKLARSGSTTSTGSSAKDDEAAVAALAPAKKSRARTPTAASETTPTPTRRGAKGPSAAAAPKPEPELVVEPSAAAPPTRRSSRRVAK